MMEHGLGRVVMEQKLLRFTKDTDFVEAVDRSRPDICRWGCILSDITLFYDVSFWLNQK